jgi:hypothetical protein
VFSSQLEGILNPTVKQKQANSLPLMLLSPHFWQSRNLCIEVPVYVVTSFLSLWAPTWSLKFTILGNCYEAYALYSFSCYLISCLGGEALVIEKLERQGLMGPRTPLLEHSSGIRAMVPHPIPLCWCIEPWELGRPFYNAVKFGIVQYVSSSVFLKCILIRFFNLFC